MSRIVLVRYGVIPEVARFRADESVGCARGERVVVESHRGIEVGTVLEITRSADSSRGQNGTTAHPEDGPSILRAATPEDELAITQFQDECRIEFDRWCERIAGWNLDLELIDLEWLLDRSKLILYVLNERGADCTKLAIYAAASGIGPVDVQPVDIGGLVRIESESGGGCGSGGCGSCGT